MKLHPYRQVSVQFTNNAKLSPKFYGPYPIVDRIGAVAYKLKLPATSKTHDVFHVSWLQKFVGEAPVAATCPDTNAASIIKEPESILDRMIVKRGNCAATKVLVKWKHQLVEEATWEFFHDLKKQFPDFNP